MGVDDVPLVAQPPTVGFKGIRPPDTPRLTCQHFKSEEIDFLAAHGFPHNCDARQSDSDDWPPNLIFDAAYGCAALKTWGLPRFINFARRRIKGDYYNNEEGDDDEGGDDDEHGDDEDDEDEDEDEDEGGDEDEGEDDDEHGDDDEDEGEDDDEHGEDDEGGGGGDNERGGGDDNAGGGDGGGEKKRSHPGSARDERAAKRLRTRFGLEPVDSQAPDSADIALGLWTQHRARMSGQEKVRMWLGSAK